MMAKLAIGLAALLAMTALADHLAGNGSTADAAAHVERPWNCAIAWTLARNERREIGDLGGEHPGR